MEEYDKDNILLSIDKSKVNDDFILGTIALRDFFNSNILNSISYYGNEGLDYLSVESNLNELYSITDY